MISTIAGLVCLRKPFIDVTAQGHDLEEGRVRKAIVVPWTSLVFGPK